MGYLGGMNTQDQWERLASSTDQSVNHVMPLGPKESLECRYVSRPNKPGTVSLYLSTQTACSRGCKFCHLTTTGQTVSRNATLEELREQAQRVLKEAEGNPQLHTVNWNFMARGEPLDVLNGDILGMLRRETSWTASRTGRWVDCRFKVSTILPRQVIREGAGEVFERLGGMAVELYWSAYNPDPAWRMAWMPSAGYFGDCVEFLEEWQRVSACRVRMHGPWIAGENDAQPTVDGLAEAALRLRADWNTVRFNPDGTTDQAESRGWLACHTRLADALDQGNLRAKVIDRVGYDVQASCGMFVS